MLRTVGYVFLVVTIGTVAIAWTGRAKGPTPATTLAPLELQQNTGALPIQRFTDRSFVFVSED